MSSAAIDDPRLRARIVRIHALPGVRAGSALLRLPGCLLAVQDDAWSIAWIRLPDLAVTLQVLRGHGGALTKLAKPDLEAALAAPDGHIYLFGSGSRANRCAVVRINPDGTGVEVRERADIYAAIRDALALPTMPNIEGAVMARGRLRLFHRGSGVAASASVDLPPDALDGGEAAVISVRRYSLGHIDGIPLHITDAAAAGAGRTAFLAAAEDTPDAIADGPVAGSVIGLIGPAGAPGWTRVLEPDGRPGTRKFEGLVLDADLRAAWLLTDPDAVDRPAELCRVELQGFA